MSFWTDLENAFKSEVTKLGPVLTNVGHFFKPLIIASAEEVAQIALQAVLTQAPLVISGQEKFNAATANVVSTLGQAGKTQGIALITAAVQGAYNAVSQAVNAPAP